MRIYIIYGSDRTNDAEGYGCEASLVYAKNKDEAIKIFCGDQTSFDETYLSIREVLPSDTAKVETICSYYE